MIKSSFAVAMLHAFPARFGLLAPTCPENLPAAGSKGPGTTRPREAPLPSLHLNYRNDCVIISRALISSPQGGYVVHAARASTASAPAPLSSRHFLIPRSGIKNARNSPENNALNFSNRLTTANCSARFSRVLRSKNHHSPVTHRGSRLTTHQSLRTNHAFLIARRQILKIELIRSQQTRKHFLIASFSGILPPPPRRNSPLYIFLAATDPNSEIWQSPENKREAIFLLHRKTHFRARAFAPAFHFATDSCILLNLCWTWDTCANIWM
jgi:hypothetical protein